MQKSQERVVVYTAVLGRKEAVPVVRSPDSRIDYLLFSDGAVTESYSPWQLRTIPSSFVDPGRDSRRVKLLPHLFLPDVDLSVWIDATVDLVDLTLERINELLGESEIALLPHPDRACVYEEASVITRRNLDTAGRVARQMLLYRALGLPENAGLYAGTFIIRRHNKPACFHFDWIWWEQFISHSRRDQLSLSYAQWLLGGMVRPLPLDLRHNSVFVWHPQRGPRPGERRAAPNPAEFVASMKRNGEAENYSLDYQSHYDSWPPDFIKHLVRLNHAIGAEDEGLRGSPLYLGGERHFLFAPPDPRLGPDREELIEAAATCKHLLVLGFGFGHEVLIALTHGTARVTALDGDPRTANSNAAAYLLQHFPDRFELVQLKSSVEAIEIREIPYDTVYIGPQASDEMTRLISVQSDEEGARCIRVVRRPHKPIDLRLTRVRNEGDQSMIANQAQTTCQAQAPALGARIIEPEAQTNRMDHEAFLARTHDVLRPRAYLEIGVWKGRTLARSNAKSIGIDPEPKVSRKLLASRPWISIYPQTSDDFFANHSRQSVLGDDRVELAFIDGLHEFSQVLRDFINVERWSAPAGVIIIHDVIPPTLRAATRERIPGPWCGDVWQLVDCLKANRPDLDLLLADTAPSGLLIIRNLNPFSDLLTAKMQQILADFSIDTDSYLETVSNYLKRIKPISSIHILDKLSGGSFATSSLAQSSAAASVDQLEHQSIAGVKQPPSSASLSLQGNVRGFNPDIHGEAAPSTGSQVLIGQREFAEEAYRGDEELFTYFGYEIGQSKVEKATREANIRRGPRQVTTVNGPTIIPVRPGLSAGVVDSAGNPIMEANWTNRNGRVERGLTSPTSAAATAQLDEEVVFLGWYDRKYGHFLLESLSRSWSLPELDSSIRLVFQGYKPDGGDPVAAEILKTLDAPASRFVHLTEPTRIRQLIVPESLYEYRHSAHEQAFDIHRVVAARLLADESAGRSDQPVYLSRGLLPNDRRQLIGEAELESIMRDNGFLIVNPERMTFADQVRLLNRHDHIFVAEGSAAHSVLFSLVKPHLHLLSGPVTRSDFILVSTIARIPTTLVNCVTTYERSPWSSTAPRALDIPKVIDYLEHLSFLSRPRRSRIAKSLSARNTEYGEAFVYRSIFDAKRSKKPVQQPILDEAEVLADLSWPISLILADHFHDLDLAKCEAMVARFARLANFERDLDRLSRYSPDVERFVPLIAADCTPQIQEQLAYTLGERFGLNLVESTRTSTKEKAPRSLKM